MTGEEACKIGLHDFQVLKEVDGDVLYTCARCGQKQVRPYQRPIRPPYDPYAEF